MVDDVYTDNEDNALFQYSLCRVVLMVILSRIDTENVVLVSVLALSSRFDGLATGNANDS